jgi:arylsulfatase A-like enzyme
MMKNLLTTILILTWLACSSAYAESKPNIIVILVDDMGFSDLGCYGSEIDTPNLDQLAGNGLRYSNFYNTSRCCPTRASLLTGLYSHQAGVGAMMEKTDKPGYLGHLNRNCVTLAEALKPAGYKTLMTGKWHVGDGDGMKPVDRGFDHYWGVLHGGGLYFKETMKLKPERKFYENAKQIEPPDDLYVTDDFTDQAIGFIDQSVKESKKPFFLYLAHIAPHWPLQAKPKDIEKYKGRYDVGWDIVREKRFDKQKQLGVIPANTVLSPRDPAAKAWSEMSEEKRKDLAHRMEIYAAQIDCIDQNVGKLIAKLRALGQLDNTLILFMSDNGCSAEGGPGGFDRGEKDAQIGTGLSYSSGGLEWANVSDTPYRNFKMFTHEGGIASPFIAHWPAGITSKGEIRKTVGHVIDVMPTLLDAGGAEYPKQVDSKEIKPYEGISLIPSFKSDTATSERVLYWEHYGKKAVRSGYWKAVSGEKNRWNLYHLKDDPSELNDLADKEPAKLEEFKELWQAWAKRCDVLK